jgi:hypothetical protein
MRVGVVQTAAQVAEASWHPASLVVVQVREAWALAGVRGSGGSGPGSCNGRGKSPGTVRRRRATWGLAQGRAAAAAAAAVQGSGQRSRADEDRHEATGCLLERQESS